MELLKNGKAIAYNDPANPLIIKIPVTLAANTSANGYVAVKKEKSGNIICPLSIYKNGEVIFQTASTGTYDVIYNAKTFTDVKNHWAAGYISFVSARSLFNGVGNNQFSPDTSMTRAMFATVLANLEGADLTAKKVRDINKSEFYADALLMYCYALRVCGLPEANHVITVLIGPAGILYAYYNFLVRSFLRESASIFKKQCVES